MSLHIFKDQYTLSLEVAKEILAMVKHKPDAVLCLAAGDTPRMAYALLAEKAKEGIISFEGCSFIGLDEWVGIPPENEGSCHYFLQHHLFGPLKINRDQLYLFNGLAEDSSRECQKMDASISTLGGIDLMLVGVGMNGHIGFNEPGVSEDLYSHVTDLDETTRSVGQKYFRQPTDIPRGITLGLRHLLQSRKAILMANGARKADIIRRAFDGAVSTAVPASVIRKHHHARVMLDEEAAALLPDSASGRQAG